MFPPIGPGDVDRAIPEANSVAFTALKPTYDDHSVCFGVNPFLCNRHSQLDFQVEFHQPVLRRTKSELARLEASIHRALHCIQQARVADAQVLWPTLSFP